MAIEFGSTRPNDCNSNKIENAYKEDEALKVEQQQQQEQQDQAIFLSSYM